MGFQSVAPGCPALDCPFWFCGAEHATNTNKVATANATRHRTTLLVLRARDKLMNTLRVILLSLFIFIPPFLFVPWLLWGLVLLDACVKRVINECRTLCGLIIILRRKGKSPAD